jgi:hypothetical protein
MKHFLLLITVFASFEANAQWSSDPSLNTPICTAANTQNSPQLISDGTGGTIIAWADKRTGEWDIYAQRINAAGVAQWTENGVAICTAANLQFDPKLVSDGEGGAIITWSDFRIGDTNSDIYSQRISAAGVVQWTADGVAICTASYFQWQQVITSDGIGGAIIAWQDDRNGGTVLNVEIYSQRISVAGVVEWNANGVAICTALNNQLSPVITSDSTNGAIIAWYDYRNGTTNSDIYSQRINVSGVIQWAINGVSICTASNFQTLGSIISDGASGAIIAWYDRRNGSPNSDIFSQRISAEGIVQWTVDGVAICIASHNQEFPVLTSDGLNGAIIAWYDNRSGTNEDIYAQRINKNGEVQWTADGAEISTVSGNQESPAIAGDGSGGAIITWRDYRSGTDYDIYAQRVFSNGTAQWDADGIIISKAAGNQESAALVSDSAGGAIITWSDKRNGSSNADIYAQRVNADGSLDGTTGLEDPKVFVPEDFLLEQNYPNPFNQNTTIHFAISKKLYVQLKVYDIIGIEVTTLVNEDKPAGNYTINFNTAIIPDGVYILKFQAGNSTDTKRMILKR